MIQRLFGLMMLLLFGWLFRRLMSGRPAGAPGSAGPARPGGEPAPGGRMVRDRVCNTFLPRSGAISLRLEGDEHFFCSETCRQRFLTEHAPSTGSAPA